MLFAADSGEKCEGGISHGQLIFVTAEFGDTDRGILFSLQETCLSVQWATAICCHCGPFRHGPEKLYLHTVYLLQCHLLAVANTSFSRKCKKSSAIICAEEY